LTAGCGVNPGGEDPAVHAEDHLFSGGFLVDPSRTVAGERDVLVRQGRVEAVAPSLRPYGQWKQEGRRLCVWDLRGLCLLPGLVDIHTHLRVPGQEHKETISSGTQAAAAGGFTTILAMPNTQPCVDRVRVLRALKKRLARESVVRVHVVAAVTQGQKGKRLAPLEDLRAEGAVAFSDDGFSVRDAKLFREALLLAERLGCPVISHCEDSALSAGGIVQEGPVAMRFGVRGIPAAAEEVMVARDILLAADTGARLHLAHVSTAKSLKMVRLAKEAGLAVTAEAAPHHFILNEEAVLRWGSNAKMNPPLRPERDRRAVLEAIRDGTVDAVASDHAPHHPDEKARSLSEAPFGVIGLETTVPLLCTLVEEGVLGIERAVELLTRGPAAAMGLGAGSVAEGRDADLVVLDRERRFRIDVHAFRSKARNSPFHGRDVSGKVLATVVQGRVVWEEADVAGRKAWI
jgi:dihydroorotase